MLAISCLHAYASASGAKVERLIAQGAYGEKPVLWFGNSADLNIGSGPPGWTATSGAKLSRKATDPWGRLDGAFGLSLGAPGGSAVAGSTMRSPLKRTGGTILMFFRPGEHARNPMILLHNADWGRPGYVSLRINPVSVRWELNLGIYEPTAKTKSTQANFATVTPGAWHFVALTWQEEGESCLWRYWAGSLHEEELTHGDKVAHPSDTSETMLQIAGRRADHTEGYGVQPLPFEDGLIRHLAIYDRPLPEATIQDIYLAAIRR